ncbi:hypothetical protein N7490_003683 [Penicillium lividum]|nr:hypothetical protein N7490_003683 [Penicillium lividum]
MSSNKATSATPVPPSRLTTRQMLQEMAESSKRNNQMTMANSQTTLEHRLFRSVVNIANSGASDVRDAAKRN